MNEIDEIKSRLDIVDVISDYVKLDKAGANYKGLCPFHKEKSPSFMVSKTKQIYHCFGCNSGGDMFEFIKQIEGVDFYDALKILAKKAGVEIKNKKENIQEKTERQKILEVLEQATKFFEYYLENSLKGKEAKKYLIERGFKEETIKEWRIGYAPNSYEKLCRFLEERGYAKKFIEKSGLGFLKQNGGICDRFRSRIIFPFFSLNSEIVGFTGRIFGEEKEVAKYLNTPNTLVYDKSKLLFGIHKAKKFIREKDEAILVEGNVDAILASQAGIKNVMAVSGTALTEIHLNILLRYTKNILFCFDMDLAGTSATKRAIDLAIGLGFNVSVLRLEGGKDPADIIKDFGEEAFLKMVLKKELIMDYYFKTAFEKRDAENLEDKKKIAEELLIEIKKIDNKIEQAYFIQKLGNMIGVKEDDLRFELDKIKENKKEIDEERIPLKKDKKEELQKKILKLYLIEKIDLNKYFFIFDDYYANLLKKLEEEEIEKVIEDKNFLSEIILGIDREKEILKENEVKVKEEILNCIYELREMWFKKEKNRLSLMIKQSQDLDQKNNLLLEYNNLIKNYDNKKN